MIEFAREGEVPGVTAVQEFTEVFRTEHRQVRDELPELAGAFGDRDAGLTWAATARERRA